MHQRNNVIVIALVWLCMLAVAARGSTTNADCRAWTSETNQQVDVAAGDTVVMAAGCAALSNVQVLFRIAPFASLTLLGWNLEGGYVTITGTNTNLTDVSVRLANCHIVADQGPAVGLTVGVGADRSTAVMARNVTLTVSDSVLWSTTTSATVSSSAAGITVDDSAGTMASLTITDVTLSVTNSLLNATGGKVAAAGGVALEFDNDNFAIVINGLSVASNNCTATAQVMVGGPHRSATTVFGVAVFNSAVGVVGFRPTVQNSRLALSASSEASFDTLPMSVVGVACAYGASVMSDGQITIKTSTVVTHAAITTPYSIVTALAGVATAGTTAVMTGTTVVVSHSAFYVAQQCTGTYHVLSVAGAAAITSLASVTGCNIIIEGALESSVTASNGVGQTLATIAGAVSTAGAVIADSFIQLYDLVSVQCTANAFGYATSAVAGAVSVSTMRAVMANTSMTFVNSTVTSVGAAMLSGAYAGKSSVGGVISVDATGAALLNCSVTVRLSNLTSTATGPVSPWSTIFGTGSLGGTALVHTCTFWLQHSTLRAVAVAYSGSARGATAVVGAAAILTPAILQDSVISIDTCDIICLTNTTSHSLSGVAGATVAASSSATVALVTVNVSRSVLSLVAFGLAHTACAVAGAAVVSAGQANAVDLVAKISSSTMTCAATTPATSGYATSVSVGGAAGADTATVLNRSTFSVVASTLFVTSTGATSSAASVGGATSASMIAAVVSDAVWVMDNSAVTITASAGALLVAVAVFGAACSYGVAQLTDGDVTIMGSTIFLNTTSKAHGASVVAGAVNAYVGSALAAQLRLRIAQSVITVTLRAGGLTATTIGGAGSTLVKMSACVSGSRLAARSFTSTASYWTYAVILGVGTAGPATFNATDIRITDSYLEATTVSAAISAATVAGCAATGAIMMSRVNISIMSSNVSVSCVASSNPVVVSIGGAAGDNGDVILEYAVISLVGLHMVSASGNTNSRSALAVAGATDSYVGSTTVRHSAVLIESCSTVSAVSSSGDHTSVAVGAASSADASLLDNTNVTLSKSHVTVLCTSTSVNHANAAIGGVSSTSAGASMRTSVMLFHTAAIGVDVQSRGSTAASLGGATSTALSADMTLTNVSVIGSIATVNVTSLGTQFAAAAMAGAVAVTGSALQSADVIACNMAITDSNVTSRLWSAAHGAAAIAGSAGAYLAAAYVWNKSTLVLGNANLTSACIANGYAASGVTAASTAVVNPQNSNGLVRTGALSSSWAFVSSCTYGLTNAVNSCGGEVTTGAAVTLCCGSDEAIASWPRVAAPIVPSSTVDLFIIIDSSCTTLSAPPSRTRSATLVVRHRRAPTRTATHAPRPRTKTFVPQRHHHTLTRQYHSVTLPHNRVKSRTVLHDTSPQPINVTSDVPTSIATAPRAQAPATSTDSLQSIGVSGTVASTVVATGYGSTAVAGALSPTNANKAATTARLVQAASCTVLNGNTPGSFPAPDSWALLPGLPLGLVDETGASKAASMNLTTLLLGFVLIAVKVLCAHRRVPNDTTLADVSETLHAVWLGFFGPTVLAVGVTLLRFPGSLPLFARVMGAISVIATLSNFVLTYVVCRREYGAAEQHRLAARLGEQLASFYEGARDVHTWYVRQLVFEDLLVALVINALGGSFPSTSTGCTVACAAMCVVALAHVLYLGVVWPYSSRVEGWLAMANAVIVIATAVLSLVALVSDSSWGATALGVALLSANAFYFVSVIVLCGAALASVLRKKQRQEASTRELLLLPSHEPIPQIPIAFNDGVVNPLVSVDEAVRHKSLAHEP